MADYQGEGTVAGYTVLYQGREPWRAVAVFDLPGGQRTVAYSEDEQMLQQMMTRECCQRAYQVAAGQFS